MQSIMLRSDSVTTSATFQIIPDETTRKRRGVNQMDLTDTLKQNNFLPLTSSGRADKELRT